jgi:hypothetical protein
MKSAFKGVQNALLPNLNSFRTIDWMTLEREFKWLAEPNRQK